MASDYSSAKRPRSPTADHPLPAAKVPRTQGGGQLQINYLARQQKETIPLVTVNEKLPELLRLLGEYDGVIQRHESIAGNLGACPLGPILLKRFDRLFDGPPRILKSHARDANVTWLDVVEFAQNKPEQFNLEKMRNGVRVCQFYTKQCRVEVSEEDFVLIASGMPQKLIPPQPILEDEEKELGVMDLLDRNLGQVIQLADQVSARARQLIHKMKNRRTAILARRENEGIERQPPLRSNGSPSSPTEPNGTNTRPIRSIETESPPMGFMAVNARQSINETNKPGGGHADDGFGSSVSNVTYINGRSIKGASPSERAEMMKKFMNASEREAAESDANRRSSMGNSRSQAIHSATETRPRSGSIDFLASSSSNKNTSTVAIPNTPASLMPQVKSPFLERDDGGPFKSEMVSRMESMQRGERVIPPCDRCRRLHMDCLKNLTACMGCTKKHAKCSWKDVRTDELHDHERGSDGEREPQRPDISNERQVTVSPPRTIADVTRAIEENTRPPSSSTGAGEKPEAVGTLGGSDGGHKERSPSRHEVARPASPKIFSQVVHKFDVRPPPLAQQIHEAARSVPPMSPPVYPHYPTYAKREYARSAEQDDNDEGDRLQALAAQVYRSASQSVKPQD